MYYLDLPNPHQLTQLMTHRHEASLSIYLKSSPVTSQAGALKLELKNLIGEGIEQVKATVGDTAEVGQLQQDLNDLAEDPSFWERQAISLAIFASPLGIQSFRLPNNLNSFVESSSRFHIKPLLRSVTFPQSGYVLALSQNQARLIEVSADVPATEIGAGDLPEDAASALGRPSVGTKNPETRLVGAEGQKRLLTQYARLVAKEVNRLIAGSTFPLILSAVEPLASIYRSVNLYPHLAPQTIGGSNDQKTPEEFAASARQIFDELYSEQIGGLLERFGDLVPSGRATSDIATAGKAAAYGAIQTLLVDIEQTIPGVYDEETGDVEFIDDDSITFGLVDGIAAKAYLSGAKVIALRGEDMPGGAALAAILRYQI